MIITDPYLWARALHLIAIIFWMVGLLYLPRLYAHHFNCKVESDSDIMLKIMEHRLLRYVMNPAMIATIALGVWLVVITGIGAPGSGSWIHFKLLLVLAMAGSHGFMSKYRKAFERGERPKSEKFFRMFSIAQTVLLILVIMLAVFKPF